MEDKDKEGLSRAEKKHEEKSNIKKQVAGIIVLLLVASGLFYGGYTYFEVRLEQVQTETEKTVSQSLQDVQESNVLTVQNMEAKLDNLLIEMEEIKVALSEADENLGASATVQKDMSQRIEELDEQMQDLKEGLNLLQEDYHEDN